MSNATLYSKLSDQYGNAEVRDDQDMMVTEMRALVENITNHKGYAGWHDVIMNTLYLAYKMGYVRAGETDQEG